MLNHIDYKRQTNWWLYILKLENDKYYVGITSKTPEKRFAEHKQRTRAAYWTIKYPPKEIIHTENLGTIPKEAAEKRENKMIRECIKKLGINNVRGGDLRDTEDYVQRFGYILSKEGWKDLLYITSMLVVTTILYVDKFIVPFIPGGVR